MKGYVSAPYLHVQMHIIPLFRKFSAFFHFSDKDLFYISLDGRVSQSECVKIGTARCTPALSLSYSSYTFPAGKISCQEVSCSRKICAHRRTGSNRGLWICWHRNWSYICTCRKSWGRYFLDRPQVLAKRANSPLLRRCLANLSTSSVNRMYFA